MLAKEKFTDDQLYLFQLEQYYNALFSIDPATTPTNSLPSAPIRPGPNLPSRFQAPSPTDIDQPHLLLLNPFQTPTLFEWEGESDLESAQPKLFLPPPELLADLPPRQPKTMMICEREEFKRNWNEFTKGSFQQPSELSLISKPLASF